MSFTSTPIKMEEEIKKEVGSQSDVDLEKASATSELGAEVAAITSFAQFPWMSDMAPTSNMQDSSTLAEAEAEAADSVEAVTNEDAVLNYFCHLGSNLQKVGGIL